MRLLDTKLWPTDRNDLSVFGNADLSPAIDHFSPMLLQNNDSLMRISIDGPPLEQFDPKFAVACFFSTPRRTTVLPYGSRKRTHKDTEYKLNIVM